jgi:hypothetical protein
MYIILKEKIGRMNIPIGSSFYIRLLQISRYMLSQKYFLSVCFDNTIIWKSQNKYGYPDALYIRRPHLEHQKSS